MPEFHDHLTLCAGKRDAFFPLATQHADSAANVLFDTGKAHLKPGRSTNRLIAFVTRFQLMSNGENQNDICVGEPAIFGHVAELAARQDQLPAPVLGFAALPTIAMDSMTADFEVWGNGQIGRGAIEAVGVCRRLPSRCASPES